jgi:glycerophosphoryl diester phosphodiesterase
MLEPERALFRLGLDDFRRSWPQLILTDLTARAVGVIVLTPMVGLLLKLFLARADDGVLADADIALFLLHPLGLTAALLIGGVSLGILFAEQGALMVIGIGATEDRRVDWLDAVRYVARYAPQMVPLAGRFLGTVGLLALPFLAAVGVIYLALLGEHDINFYLSTRPPEFKTALALAGLLVAVLAVLVLRVVAGAIVAIPLVLFEGCRGWDAMRASRARVGEKKGRVAFMIVLWLLTLALVGWVASQLIGLAAGVLMPDLGAGLGLYTLGLAATLLLMGTVHLVVAIFGTALFPLLVVRFYREIGGTGHLDEKMTTTPLGSHATFSLSGRRWLVGGAAVLLLIATAGHVVAVGYEAEQGAQVIAHRGASADAPENTMAAFELAVEQQADWIELDVQEDAEGRVIVAHDSDFMKVARNPLKTWEATDAELADLDIGSWFDAAFNDQRVVTLREVLESARGRAGIVIELKYYGHDQRLEERVVEIVEATGMQDDVMLMSLKLDGLQKAGALRPQWTRGLLNTVSVGDLTQLDVDFLALNAAAASAAMIRHAHERGLRVFVWTINDPVQMSVMLSRGVDGLITDEPAIARRVMEVRETLGPLGRLVLRIAGETGLLRTPRASAAENA